MKILHTSDWHLGRHLGDKTRAEEHDLFLTWLVNQLREKHADVLIVAGDIFDTGYPPNFALKQYYDFLRQIPDTPCRNVIITGGNHDAVSTLNAPRDLLKYLDIHVVGGAEEDIAREVITIKDKNSDPLGIVCAVPFLRTRDIKKAVAGETYEQKEKGIIKGIARHYQNVCIHAVALKKKLGMNLPIIATGHLFASGCMVTESMRDIYVGNLGRVGSESFPPEFDYVALGHLHHARTVDKKDHIRYSGSPIPLSFSEAGTEKIVLQAEFDANGLTTVQSYEIPCFRKLRRIRGCFEDIAEQLETYEKKPGELRPWGEVRVETDQFDPGLYDKVTDLAKGKETEILMVKINRNYEQSTGLKAENMNDLEELDPGDIFLKKCDTEGITGEDRDDLFRAFQELLSEVQES